MRCNTIKETLPEKNALLFFALSVRYNSFYVVTVKTERNNKDTFCFFRQNFKFRNFIIRLTPEYILG